MSGVFTERCRFTCDNYEKHASSCYREVWKDYDRCIWHAEVGDEVDKPIKELQSVRETEDNQCRNKGREGSNPTELLDGARLSGVEFGDALPFDYCSLRDADLSGVDLGGAPLSGADLSGVDLGGADLPKADLWEADISGADLWLSDLSGVDLGGADLSGVDLGGADLPKADLRDADLTGSDLRDADLTGSDLRDADLTGSDLRDADLSRVQMNQGTQCGRQQRAHQRASNPQDWDSIARAYHIIKSRFSDEGLVGKARRHHLLERQARGKEAKTEGGFSGNLAYLGSLASRYLTGYGIDYRRMLVVMGFVFGVSTFIFWLGGVRDSIYFSVVTFTTAPPWEPPPGLTEWTAMIETFLGTLLVVLLGYVLGNRESF